MNLGVLFSGGKDSHLAMYRAMKYHNISCLISIISENKESYMFHVPNIEITEIQAKAIGLPIITWRSKGEKEKELEDLKKAIEYAINKYNIEGIVSGAIRSIYQSTRIQSICKELDIWCFNPLWLEDDEKILREVIENKFEVIISGVFAYPLDKKFLGRRIDYNTLQELKEIKEKYGINIAGEGGEIETTVLDAPFYKKKINILDYEIEYENYSGVFKIKKVELVEK